MRSVVFIIVVMVVFILGIVLEFVCHVLLFKISHTEKSNGLQSGETSCYSIKSWKYKVELHSVNLLIYISIGKRHVLFRNFDGIRLINIPAIHSYCLPVTYPNNLELTGISFINIHLLSTS